ncbi:GNAT family N-acetyltransferase [Hoeflea prorocentri]|uniref:GNAT family protein n=1 Tax=Hoeflea prorocentri TaxID=1922333 RepID=A0A9X3UHS4_9HYPH|nr:GNAT family protein [Hoeflea prorocentri]MCY6381648.1 GNAT family protein [Hoeflea prorocentri]MDA5399448.1 GNAT family protein [Hoeflea prorocentri]
MSPLRLLSRRETAPRIDGDSVYLRFPERRDYSIWADVRGASRGFLEPWEPTWPRNDLTKAAFHQRVNRYEQDFREKRSVSFFLFLKKDDRLVGGLNIGNIRRAAAQTCMIGYWMSEENAGKGLMLDGLNAAIPYIFDQLQLHRIEAACIPDNKRSVRLLEKANFRYEGYLRGYLKINGMWRDHHLYALLASDRSADGPSATSQENSGS